MQKIDWTRAFRIMGNLFYVFIWCIMVNSLTILIAGKNIFGAYQTDEQWGIAAVLFFVGLLFFVIVGIFKFVIYLKRIWYNNRSSN